MNIEKIKNLYFNKKRNVQEIADELGYSFWQVYELMKKNNVLRRTPSEINYLKSDKDKPKFVLKEPMDADGEKLKIAAIMLYWAEGAKEGGTIDLANSNPEMIKVFLRFLREICGIAEKRIRIYLYAFEDQNVLELKNYWNKITQVPQSQFTKPYIRRRNTNKTDRRMPYGIVHVRYNDKRLFGKIKEWLSEYIVLFSHGEMPEQSNGPDCIKCSAIGKPVV